LRPAHRRIEPREITLHNGLRVVLVPNSRLPTVAVNLTILAGSRNESEKSAGSAALISRLLDEGTESRSSLEIADAIESVGGSIDCDCGYDRTFVLLAVLAQDLVLGLDLVADIVSRPSFDSDSLEHERQRTLAEIRSAMDRPQVVAGWEFDEVVYEGHPLHRPVHGYPETIRALGRHDLVDFHGRYFRPNNAILALVGDFPVEQMASRLEDAFGRWEASRFEARPVGPPPRHQGIRYRHISIESAQAHVYFGHLGIERTHPDFYALQVLDAILGGSAGLTSRLPRKLRDEMGLAYTTFASITSSASLDPGKFLAYIGTSPENVERATKGFLEEIDRIRSVPVDEAELADAKAYLTGSFAFGFESNAQVARFLTNACIFGLGYDYVERYPGMIEAIGVEDIQRVAARHLSTKDFALVVAGPKGAGRLEDDGSA
jgi:zinc protease